MAHRIQDGASPCLSLLFPLLALGQERRRFRRFQALAELRLAWQREREAEGREAQGVFRSFAGYDPRSWRGETGFCRRAEAAGARLEGRVVSTKEVPETLVQIEPLSEGRDWAFLLLDSGGGSSAPLLTGLAAALFRESLRRAAEGGRDFPLADFLKAFESSLERVGRGNAMATGLVGNYSVRGGHLSLLPFGVDRIALARTDGSGALLELPPSLPANAFEPSPARLFVERSLFNLTLEPGDAILAYGGEAPWWRSGAEALWRGIRSGGSALLKGAAGSDLELSFDRSRKGLASPALLAAAALTLPFLRDVDLPEEDSVFSLPERRIAIDRELLAEMEAISPFPLGLRLGQREAESEEEGFFSLGAERLRPFRLDCAVLTIENRGLELGRVLGGGREGGSC